MMRKVAARTAAVVVALVAGAASYQHIASVALLAGEPEWVAYSLPFAIDGLIVVGVAALLEDKAANLLPRRSAWAAVVVGVAATLAANVASAEPTVTARLVAAAAPVAFLISVEVLTRSGRPRPATSDTATGDSDTSATATGDSTATATGDSTATATGDSTATATGDSATTSGATGVATTGDSTATATPSRRRQVSPRQVSRQRQSSADRVAAAVAAAPGATAAELADQLGLSVRTVQRHRAAAVAANGHLGGGDH